MDNSKINNPDDEVVTNPFQKSSKLAKSPPIQQDTPKQQKEVESEQQTIDIDLTEDAEKEDSHFLKLGKQITLLVGMLKENGGSRRSIHQPMRDAIESIRLLYELSAIQTRDEAAKEVIRANNSSQTTPGLIRMDTKKKIKRKMASTEDPAETPNPKRRQEKSPKKSFAEPAGAPIPAKGSKETENKEESWKKVTSKKARKKPEKKEEKKEEKASKEPRKPKPKPDAILIESKGEKSYVDLLTSIKCDPKLEEVGKAVFRIRKTRKGDLLLQMSESGAKIAELQQSLNEVLGEEATAKVLSHRVTLEIRDMDGITKKEEISAAIKDQFQIEEVPAEKITIHKVYREQIATFSLPAENAKALLEVGKIKIGWIVSRIREVTPVTKCFKCLENGHIAKHCKNEDRSKLCRKCGIEGHIAKDCQNAPSCMFCKNDPKKDASHIASTKCFTVSKKASKRK